MAQTLVSLPALLPVEIHALESWKFEAQPAAVIQQTFVISFTLLFAGTAMPLAVNTAGIPTLDEVVVRAKANIRISSSRN